MNSLLGFGVLFGALAFCGLGERLQQMQGGGANSGGSGGGTASKPADSGIELAEMTAAQRAIADGGTDAVWEQQGLAWRVPAGWKQTDKKKEMFNYSSGDGAFFLVNISMMPPDFPVDASIQAYYDQAMQQLRIGKYSKVRRLEIDGLKGVEFIEAPPEERDGIRRHQWIAYRSHLGEKQMLNVMTTTSGDNFERNTDKFPAILYSLKLAR